MIDVIEPHYAPGNGRGRKPFALESMLRAHVAQIIYNYSDPGMEDALYEIESLRRFCGIRLEAVPDESTILQFRHLLEKHGLMDQIFQVINQTLGERGLFLKVGTIVDASLIAAPATFAVHADLDTVILQQSSEFQAGELAPLVSIEDVRLAILTK
ncbi:MAG: hypothetical protein RI993_342 [Pseudomonadota bacterium]|jgi:IS5 family transposase